MFAPQNEYDVTDQFVGAINDAIKRLVEDPDPAVAAAAMWVPVHARAYPTPDQTVGAGGCDDCVYLGMWAPAWPGYPDSPHGHIWIFEQGIRTVTRNLWAQVFDTLYHEIDHCLGRDHVLEHLSEVQAAGMMLAPWPMYQAYPLGEAPAVAPGCG